MKKPETLRQQKRTSNCYYPVAVREEKSGSGQVGHPKGVSRHGRKRTPSVSRRASCLFCGKSRGSDIWRPNCGKSNQTQMIEDNTARERVAVFEERKYSATP